MDSYEIGLWMLSFLAGMGIGAFFYMGLWWTLFIGVSAKHPTLWWLISFIARVGIAAVIFYWVAGEFFARYAFLLLGFMASRKKVFNIKTLKTGEG